MKHSALPHVSMDFFKRLQAVTRQVLDWKQMASILGCHWTSVQKRVIKLWYSWQKWSKVQANTLFFFPIQEKEGHVQEVWKVFFRYFETSESRI